MLGTSLIKTTPVAGAKTLRAVTTALTLALAVVGMTATAAHATLVELDLNAPGDKLITRDDATGLQWLDVTATAGLSFNQAELSTFVTAQGFRHATINEVSSLFTNAGITDQTNNFASSNLPGASEIMLKLGCTDCTINGVQDQIGLAALLSILPVPGFPVPQASLTISNGAARAILHSSFFAIDYGTPAVGHYLVRASAVPEPPSWALLLTGLFFLAGFRLRRQSGEARRAVAL